MTEFDKVYKHLAKLGERMERTEEAIRAFARNQANGYQNAKVIAQAIDAISSKMGGTLRILFEKQLITQPEVDELINNGEILTKYTDLLTAPNMSVEVMIAKLFVHIKDIALRQDRMIELLRSKGTLQEADLSTQGEAAKLQEELLRKDPEPAPVPVSGDDAEFLLVHGGESPAPVIMTDEVKPN